MRLTDDQLTLRHTVRRLLAASPPDLWQRLVDLGAPALLVPEDHGGLGAGLAEVYTVQYELGATLAGTPLLSSVLAATALPPGQTLTAVAGGTVAALAWSAPDQATGRVTGQVTGRVTEQAGRLTGRVTHVLDGDTAEILLVAAGDTLHRVDPAHASVTHTPALDPTRPLATVDLDHTPAEPLGPFDADRVRDVACTALAAEQAGTAARCLELTVAHTLLRRQFGRPIGSFQALKHRMADLHVLVTTAESAAMAAALADPADLPVRAAAAAAHCAEALRTVAGEMIQLHGGIAITWDHDAHRYLRRAHGGGQLFGTPAAHVDRLARLVGF
ncbi:hypothetical protein BLA60_10440 [Actinophytocola xinjiangensis]|uniref:Acyl-CoA dehydrogenase n=1 Tax=Actinophytocola xinjiangensis TaxID=485602 RepID=A0A7Z0WN08_9PSEU|nr:acyl-CoA dehydrogenase family protein [Actinophytocola xinjiangensis]OLF11393.1 hypothetical protein BLA60_10440 [Actinophytocola xinjiangensis]